MKYEEAIKDLFSVDNSYYLAHCISSDAKMGAGIAVQFRKKFNLSHMSDRAKVEPYDIGTCVQKGRALNLITKDRYWHKPTYDSFTKSVEDMKSVCLKEGIKKVAMPKIGAGLDRLEWFANKEIIQRIFKDTDIEILVCIFK